MPEPPEDGVTSPARRNRTRSIVRLSPATSLRSSEIRICNINGDVCVNEKVT
jgi:hypothetical protein